MTTGTAWTLSPGKLWGLRRLADRQGRFKMTAVDQRPPIKNLICQRRSTETPPAADVSAVKALLTKVLAPASSAMLLDPHWAYPAAIQHVDPRQGLILTLEDSLFTETPKGRMSAAIPDWSVDKIKRIGGDAVKVLAWYRPDAGADVCAHQRAFVRAVGAACRRLDIPFVFELLVYPMGGANDYLEDPGKRPDMVVDSVRTFAGPEFGVDLFKLESPIAANDVPDPDGPDAAATQAWFDALGNAAGRPWVMLSAGAGKAAFERILTYAYRAGANGYLAGRAIWWESFQAFPDLGAMERALAADGLPYMARINELTDRTARPFTKRPGFEHGFGIAPTAEGFCQSYPATDAAGGPA